MNQSNSREIARYMPAHPRLLERLTIITVILMALVFAAPGAGAQQQGNVGRYIVTLRSDVADPGAEASALGRAHRFTADHVYQYALKGFSAAIPGSALAGLRRNPLVVSIELDQPVQADAQTMPPGIDRVEADRDPTANIDGVDERVNVPVAVLDTGVGPNSDLNVMGGADCANDGKTDFFTDDNGHGTHVSGIFGALDNDLDVVGVAPGAPIYSVKVLNRFSVGNMSDVLCGVDWVTANAGIIRVANLSLSANSGVGDERACGDTSAFHQAICNSVNAGVTYVVSAGNSGADASLKIPARYAEVITVSAIADFDGKPGALSTQTFTCPNGRVSADDSFACFSNFGSVVDIAAPGVAIQSSAIGGGTAVRSGTSQAAPHVTGAAALYIATNPGSSPGAVKSALQANAAETTSSLSSPTDPDGVTNQSCTRIGALARIQPRRQPKPRRRRQRTHQPPRLRQPRQRPRCPRIRPRLRRPTRRRPCRLTPRRPYQRTRRHLSQPIRLLRYHPRQPGHRCHLPSLRYRARPTRRLS